MPPDDAQHLPDLVHTGLDAGGYHLRLALLYAAQFDCGVLDPDSRSRMIDVLNASYPSACRAARPDAGFPRPKRLDEFSYEANPAINPAVIGKLATCGWVKAGHPLCLIGGSGTGKTHFMIALGTVAAEAGYRVRYTLASKLVNELVEAADDRQLTKLINRYGRVDLILVNELGYLA